MPIILQACETLRAVWLFEHAGLARIIFGPCHDGVLWKRMAGATQPGQLPRHGSNDAIASKTIRSKAPAP